MKNVLLLVVDCLGYDFVSGGTRGKYPCLSSLFSMGTSFSQAISATSTTTPSLASILTGSYSLRHGVSTLGGSRLSMQVPAIAEVLQENGYNTYAEVTGPLYPELGFSRGFDVYNHRDQTERLAWEWGEEFRRKLDSGHYKKPWFILLHVWELHEPRQILAQYNKKSYGAPYERALKSLDHVFEKVFNHVLDVSKTILILTGDHGEQIEKSLIDKKLKSLLRSVYNKLSGFGLLREHWLEVYKKCYVGHGYNISENLMRVPLLFIGDGVLPEGVEFDFQVSHVDIFPTLLSLLGIEDDFEIDGRTVLPYVKSGKGDPEHIAYMQACGIVLPDPSKHLEGIRYKGLKYVRQLRSGANSEWLYDLNKDHSEKNRIRDERLLGFMREKFNTFKESHSTSNQEVKMSAEETNLMKRRLKELGYM
ncbi:MAG: sulfatase-like hydrolase/transferase [Planctomycetota bacterium]|jgi:arylsulfatase A-like enzyme